MRHDVCAAEDLAEGEMRTVEAAGKKVLLARIGGRYHAVAATCPHAGGPLGEGALRDGIVTCLWHKATFCLATGERVEPPAVDDLPLFPVRVVGGRVMITVPEKADRVMPVITPSDTRCMAIVGAGAAGALAAQTLRKAGFSGRVVLIGQEERLPYDRTVLSKYALSGNKGGEKTPLQSDAFYERHRIERLTRQVSHSMPRRALAGTPRVVRVLS